MERLKGIQVLRGVAAIGVVALHAANRVKGLTNTQLSPLWIVGDHGVDVFFVISGFIMFHTSGRDFGGASEGMEFIARRVIRIAPLLWIMSLAMVVFLVLRDDTPPLSSVISTLTLVPYDWSVLDVSWTLSYEMYFYVLFAFFIFAAAQRYRAFLIISAIVAIVVAGHLLVTAPPMEGDGLEVMGWHFLSNPIAIEFCFGILLARFISLEDVGSLWPIMAGAAALLVMIGNGFFYASSEYLHLHLPEIRWLIMGVPAAVLVAAALKARVLSGPISSFGLLCGDASYSIYLSHLFAIIGCLWILKQVAPNMPAPLMALAIIIVSCLSGISVFLVIERPITRYLQARFSPKRRVTVSA